ncbi:hypothetical protein BsWGS_24246 [Bradybaena similaris]
MSASNIVTEAVNNKVLPGDKSGLPWELWQFILSWLSAADLCRVSCVCKTWAELVASVDSTRWKELYLGCSEWRHPFWPLNTQTEPPSWRLAYQDQYTSTRFWCQRKKREAKNVTCTTLFKKSIFQRSIHVGPGLAHESLKAALAIASDYDRIIMHPGIYDEQLEVMIKVPLELVGHGELGSVILNVGVKQLSTSTRLTGLVLRAPWFTSFIINVNSGYLQIDNCILEDGILCCRNPCNVYIKFCTFRHASVILQHMNMGIIENCELSQSGGANVFIEGHPKDEKSWAYSFLKERSKSIYHQNRSLHGRKRELKASCSVTSTIQSSFTTKSLTSAISGPHSDMVVHEGSLNFDALEGNSWKCNILGTNYVDPVADNLIGCGDIQSVCEDCVSVKQSEETPSLLAAGTRNKTEPSKQARASNECSAILPFSEKVKVFDAGANNSEEVFDKDNHDIIELSDRVTQSESQASSSVSSLQQIYEKLCTHSVEERHFCKRCNNEKDNSLTSGFSSLKTLSDSKTTSQSALRKINHRKSIDSHVSFNLNENLSDSQPLLGNVNQGYDKHAGVSQISNSVALLAETVHSKLPPIPKLSPVKISDKGKQSVDYLEAINKRSDQSSLVNIKHLTNTEIDETDNTEVVNVLKDKSGKQLHQKQMLNMGIETNSFEKMKTCSIEIDMSSISQSSNTLNNEDKRTGDLNISINNASQNSDVSDYHHKILGSQSLTTSNQIPLCIFSSQSVASCYNSPVANTVENAVVSCYNSPVANTVENDDIKEKLFDSSCCKNDDSLSRLLDNSQNQSEVCDDIKGLKPPRLEQCDYSDDVLSCQPKAELPPVRRSQSDEVLLKSDDEISILDEVEQSDDSSETESDIYETSSPSTDSSDVGSSMHFTDTDEEFSNNEESVIMLPHLRELHLSKSENPCSPVGVDEDAASVTSDYTKPVPVNIFEDTDMSTYVEQIHGCLIHQCRMNHSKGGLMISLQAHAVVSECDISDVGYGIRCIQNSRVVILRNKIHHCQTSGIFMRLAASGLIVGNDVHSNTEAGIDIRKNADPLVQFNQIHHGKRSGIVVLGSGCGHIKKNDIYSNAEAGVYVLYGGNPVIRENYIYEGRAAGVAIYAGGKGCIIDNVIRGNHWGGIDIRNGGSSLVTGNSIISGISHGIVVGLDGKASIENNLISGNAGCGIWMMATDSVKIHGNQICSNGHCGVLMLDKTAYMSSSMARHLDPLPADVNERVFSRCSDGVPCLETSSNVALLQYNNIYYNKGEGVRVEMNKEVQLLYNALHANKGDGVFMNHDSPAVVEANSVTNNGGSGIVTSHCGKCSLVGNGIYDNSQNGIVCRNNCVIDQNDVVGHPVCAVLVKDKSSVQITQNRLCSSDEAAVKGEKLCAITATNNKIYDSGEGDFNCQGELTSTENILVRADLLSRKPGKNGFSKTDFLSDPPQRPQVPPPPQSSTDVPNCHITLVTKVSTASNNNTCEEGSKLCVIL